jgi:hypothetical protein
LNCYEIREPLQNEAAQLTAADAIDADRNFERPAKRRAALAHFRDHVK